MIARLERLRRHRLTGVAITRTLGLARSTVGAVLRRIGLGRLSALEPKAPVSRYERAAPGELVHLDNKKLGLFTRSGHRVTGRGPGTHSDDVGVGTICMSASMMPRAWPTSRSCPTRTSTTPAPSPASL